LIVGDYLFKLYPDAEEGKLTKIRSRLVNRKALYEYSKNIDLEKFILMNPGAIISFPKGIESILADAFESLVAAIYLDGGYNSSKNFITNFILSDSRTMQRAFFDDNYKSALLEYAQSVGLGSPKYETIQEEGPNHDPIFTVQVFVSNEITGNGKGRNKKEAEQEAAKDALIKNALL
jgi:ribonuclease-3